MEWEFSPEQVVKGEIYYPLEDYREDLWEEVSDYTDPEGFEVLFWALYHFAMGYSSREMADRMRRLHELTEEETQSQKQQFELIKSTHAPDIEMLKALIKRQVLNYREEGVDVETGQALREYIREWITEVVKNHEVGHGSRQGNGELDGPE